MMRSWFSKSFFTVLIVAGCFALWFAKADPAYLYVALIFMVIANISSEMAMVFYNAMMRDLVTKERFGRLSGIGWAFGYIGGLIALCICQFVIIRDMGKEHVHSITKRSKYFNIPLHFVQSQSHPLKWNCYKRPLGCEILKLLSARS